MHCQNIQRRNTLSGFTFLELLFTLAITAVLLGIALPALSNTVKRINSLSVSNQMTTLVNFARAEAISNNISVTLCGSSNGLRCDGAWSISILVFTDKNSTGQFDGSDILLSNAAFLTSGETLAWRSFRNKPYLQLHPSGLTYFQNGNFTYCPADGDAHFALHWILNVSGRLRLATDSNADGIPEKTNGENVAC